MPKRQVKTVTVACGPTFGCFTILGIILTLMKVMGVEGIADLSWWVILLPFYVVPMLMMFLSVMFFGSAVMVVLLTAFLSLF